MDIRSTIGRPTIAHVTSLIVHQLGRWKETWSSRVCLRQHSQRHGRQDVAIAPRSDFGFYASESIDRVLTVFHPVAAASDDALLHREFDGGTLAIHASKVRGQFFLVVHFRSMAEAPTHIVLRQACGAFIRRPLPPPDLDGITIIRQDVSDPGDREFIRAVCDPMNSGAFLVCAQ
jgi:hypothetical protein